MEAKDGLRTYEDWIALGRVVRNGQRAQHFALSPDASERKALFAEDQTDELETPKDWFLWAVVPADELPNTKQRYIRPKAIANLNSETGRLKIWVGPNTTVISKLKKSGFIYSPGDHRWVVENRSEIESSIKALEHYGCRVEAYVDGKEYIPEGQI